MGYTQRQLEQEDAIQREQVYSSLVAQDGFTSERRMSAPPLGGHRQHQRVEEQRGSTPSPVMVSAGVVSSIVLSEVGQSKHKQNDPDLSVRVVCVCRG
jgi:hypothetical protein